MPLDAKPAAIVMHFDSANSDTIAKRLASDGYNVVIPFYRSSVGLFGPAGDADTLALSILAEVAS
jgi:hypothetical protein